MQCFARAWSTISVSPNGTLRVSVAVADGCARAPGASEATAAMPRAMTAVAYCFMFDLTFGMSLYWWTISGTICDHSMVLNQTDAAKRLRHPRQLCGTQSSRRPRGLRQHEESRGPFARQGAQIGSSLYSKT